MCKISPVMSEGRPRNKGFIALPDSVVFMNIYIYISTYMYIYTKEYSDAFACSIGDITALSGPT